jgi:hypothetical protein
MYRLDKSISKTQTFSDAERSNIFDKTVTLSERLNQGWYLSAMAHGADPFNPPKMTKQLVSKRKHTR